MMGSRFSMGLVAFALAAAPLAHASGVNYSARVDRNGKAWVDVENESPRDVDVRKVELSFEDGSGQPLRRQALPCKEDCRVKAGEKGSFGPIAGPKSWESFRIERLLFVESGKDASRSAPAPRIPPQQSPRKPTGAAVTSASEAMTCNEYCRLLASLPGCSSRSDIPACVESCRGGEAMTACRSLIDRFFQCVAKEPPNCVDGRPAFGGCSEQEREYRNCVRE